MNFSIFFYMFLILHYFFLFCSSVKLILLVSKRIPLQIMLVLENIRAINGVMRLIMAMF